VANRRAPVVYHPFMALDTSPETTAVLYELYRQIGEAGRARIAADLSDALRELVYAGVRQRHPGYCEEQIRVEMLRVFYGSRTNGNNLRAAAWETVSKSGGACPPRDAN